MSPRGEFLSALFKILERHGVGYCVLRNYENLYEDESSDVDLAVQPEDVPGLEVSLAEAGDASGHRLVQRARFINYSHVYWNSDGGFLRVDFDTEFRWRIFPVLTAKSVITLRRREGEFYVPHPRHESVILLLAATERAELSERYRAKLGRLYDQLASPEELTRTFCSAFGLAGSDLALCQEEAANPVREVQNEIVSGSGSALWRRVRTSLVRNSFRDRPSRRLLWKYLRGDVRRLWERMKSPVGLSILYASAAPNQKGFEEFLEGTEVLFPPSKRVQMCGARGKALQRLRVLFKGGLFVRTVRVEKDTDLKNAVCARARFLFPSRELIWVQASNGQCFLAQSGSGFMAEFGAPASERETEVASARIIDLLSLALQSGAGRKAPRQGAFVVLAGLDGSGKTTVAREICCQAGRAGFIRGVQYFHWRPAIFGAAALPLPEFRNILRKEKLSASPLQTLLSAVRLTKNLLLSSVAWWRVAHCVERGDLVLVDRYYYNYYLDPVSVKYYGPRWLLNCLASYFPPPDIVALLRAPAEVLLARKQELNAEEITRQNDLLNKVPYNAPTVLELDASRPPAESATDILRRVGRGRLEASRGPWEKLFATPENRDESLLLPMRLLRRGGQPFLLLPKSAALAAKSLELYSPQTRRARAAKAGMGMALRLGLTRRVEPVAVRVHCENRFVAYLAQIAGTRLSQLPEFGMLAGNPRVAGQRVIILLFDAGGGPKAVVKAGTDEEGFGLIEREVNFLKSALPGTPGVPRLLSNFRSANVSAFAMEYVSGKSPRSGAATLESLLTSWIDSGRKVPFRELGVWQRLEAACSLPEAVSKLGSVTVNPVIFHGDFAPWNIKARGDDWTLVDWERGELAGPPLWDWLHFIVQPAILVERCSTEQARTRIDALLESPEVKRYVERSGITGNERALVLAYLEYCVHVLQPTEGLQELQALAAAVGSGR